MSTPGETVRNTVDAPPASTTPALLRVLGAAALTSLGVGGTIGTGIFVIAGAAAKQVAGPAIIVSFLVAALTCGCAALCYAELAARYPQAGSAYAYGRALVGKLPAWLIGWNLLLQYGVAAASIAQGWSHYFQETLVAVFGTSAQIPLSVRGAFASFPGAVIDLSALGIVVAITALLLRGIRLSMVVNHAVVGLKLLVVLLIIGVGVFYIHPENWQPFAPFGWGGLNLPGLGGSGHPQGMMAGASLVFFAYLGFEALTNYSEETRSPQRDVPLGILRSLAICTLLYMAMATVLTGMVRYDLLSKEAPVSEAFGQVGLPWIRTTIAVGALISITSVLLVILLSLPRLLLAIGRDNILPRLWTQGITLSGVPLQATLLGGVLVALMTAFVPLDALGVVAVLSNIVTFIVVALLVLRLRQQPVSESGFRAPFGIVAPLVTMATCVLLMLGLPWFGWVVLVAWLTLGVGIYAIRHKSAEM